ncbi:Jid1p PWA37_003820 [Arxiozyma heterogenica]|uniref:Jid1p n=1 Tax=Arxiozyma heterogenica TaxID=278026 RepID=UPI002F107A73
MNKIRFYSTTKTHIDHLWPSGSLNPTPYEIFHLKDFEIRNNNNNNDNDNDNDNRDRDRDRGGGSSSSLTRSKYLKNIYHQYVKLYHPDISTNIIIFDQKNDNILSPREKLKRFKSISVAYKQLLTGQNVHNNPIYPYSSYSSHPHPHFYAHAYSHNYQPYPIYEKCESDVSDINPLHILYMAIGTLVVWGGSIYLNNLQDSIHLSNQYTVNSQTIEKQDIQRVYWQQLYEKYIGFTGSKMDRIHRFLWIRLWNKESPRDETELEASLKNNHLFIERLLEELSRKN